MLESTLVKEYRISWMEVGGKKMFDDYPWKKRDSRAATSLTDYSIQVTRSHPLTYSTYVTQRDSIKYYPILFGRISYCGMFYFDMATAPRSERNTEYWLDCQTKWNSIYQRRSIDVRQTIRLVYVSACSAKLFYTL